MKALTHLDDVLRSGHTALDKYRITKCICYLTTYMSVIRVGRYIVILFVASNH